MKTRKAFTLIEILISLSIFLLLIGVLMSAFFQLQKSQREANETRKVTADLRTLVNFVQDEMRAKTIDFQAYPDSHPDFWKLSLNQVRDTLILVNKERTEQTIITFVLDKQLVQPRGRVTFQRRVRLTSDDGWGAAPGYSDPKELSIPHLQLSLVKFSLAPMADTNKNLADAVYQIQPSVTMHVSFGNNYTLQTTFSSRVY